MEGIILEEELESRSLKLLAFLYRKTLADGAGGVVADNALYGNHLKLLDKELGVAEKSLNLSGNACSLKLVSFLKKIISFSGSSVA